MANSLFEYRSYNDAKVELLLEANTITGKKDLYMKGIFIQGDKRNHNQRVYPGREIEKAVNDLSRKINSGSGTVMGELEHSEDLSVNLQRVSHIITEMWMEGSDGYGKLKLVPTPLLKRYSKKVLN